jgi:hypothetical protein
LDKALAAPDALKPENAERARAVLQEQRDRIGQVVVTTNVKEGIVEVDNVEASRLPLAGPLEVASGRHILGVVSPGYAPSRKQLTVAGHERVEAHLELVAIEGRLAHVSVSSRIPAAEVLVDGEAVGKTPLETTITVTPGTHRIALRRPGYLSAERELPLQDGATGDVKLEPSVDKAKLAQEGGFLDVRPSEGQAVATVDGESVGVVQGPVELPAGPHRLRLERSGFLPTERDIVVPLGRTETLPVRLEPTPETRERYVSAASSRRLWSWVTIGAGAVIAGGGAALAAVEGGALSSAQSSLAAVNATWVRGSGMSCDFSQNLSGPQMASCESALNDATSRVNNAQTSQTVGWVATGVGAATLVAGVVLLLTGDDPHRYDSPALPGPGIGLLPIVQMSGAGVLATGSF